MSDASMLTPGGPRPRRLVQAVGPAGTVRYAPDGEAHVVVAAREPVAEGHVVTPGGPRHPSLVHAVPPGHAVDLSGDAAQLVELSTDRRIAVAPPAPEADPAPALGSGWIAYAFWSNGTGTPLSSFRTSWRVPEAPQSQDGQTIFLFNGIQNGGANFGILQPVLQWGPSAAGGGAYWSVASWYVTEGGQAFHTTLVRVSSGDALVGVMTLTGSSGGSFDYVSQFAGIAGTLLTMQGIAELTWCNETLEAYSVAQCSDYPDVDATRFGEISIETGGKPPRLAWTAENAVTDCGQHAVVVSNANPGGEIDLYYAADSFAPVFHQGDPGSGIGGYDLRSAADRAFAFDYDGTGKLDHLALYRPGTGTFWILEHT